VVGITQSSSRDPKLSAESCVGRPRSTRFTRYIIGGVGRGGPMSMGPGGKRPVGCGDPEPGAVVIIYGLRKGKFNCDKLFNILCGYGNVCRVGIYIIVHYPLIKYSSTLNVPSHSHYVSLSRCVKLILYLHFITSLHTCYYYRLLFICRYCIKMALCKNYPLGLMAQIFPVQWCEPNCCVISNSALGFMSTVC